MRGKDERRSTDKAIMLCHTSETGYLGPFIPLYTGKNMGGTNWPGS